MTKYAISDIHACSKSFEALLDKIAFSTSDELYLLGDYVDRGPNSKAVIDQILNLKSKGYKVHCLKGNHEELFLGAINGNLEYKEIWLRNGGKQMLQSFEVNEVSDIPQAYTDFSKDLDYYYEVDQYILVHAGLNFRRMDPLSDKEAMLWARSWENDIDSNWLNGRIIVHGHTPTSRTQIEKSCKQLHKKGRIVIDSGCVYTHSGMNQLCAFDLDNQELYFQENLDPVNWQ